MGKAMSEPKQQVSQWALHAAGRIGVGDFQVDPAKFAGIIQEAMNWALLEKDQELSRLKCDLAHTQADRDAAIALVDMRQREIAEKDKEIGRLKSYLERAGWGECNIPACNCSGWHQLRSSREEMEMAKLISNLEQRLREAEARLLERGEH
jgi:hypothetical protein